MYSMGGLIAHAWALQLRAQGLPEPERLFIAACSGPDWPASIDPDAIDTPAFIAYLKQLGGTPEEVFEHQELLELVLPLLRNDFRLVRRLRERTYGAALQRPITTLAALDDTHAPPAAVASWARRSTVPLDRVLLPGGHFTMLQQPDAMVARMVAALASETLPMELLDEQMSGA